MREALEGSESASTEKDLHQNENYGWSSSDLDLQLCMMLSKDQ